MFQHLADADNYDWRTGVWRSDTGDAANPDALDDREEEVVAFLDRPGQEKLCAALEKAVQHPSNQRQNVANTFATRARSERERRERHATRRQQAVKQRSEQSLRAATVRREEVLHIQAMRRHVEQRMGLSSVRNHPAFVGMGGDDQSCFF